jgi:hypothetical protein
VSSGGLGAEILEEPLAVTEQDRHHGEIELVEQPGGEVLLHHLRSAG